MDEKKSYVKLEMFGGLLKIYQEMQSDGRQVLSFKETSFKSQPYMLYKQHN